MKKILYIIYFIFFTFYTAFANDIAINQSFAQKEPIGFGFDFLKNKIRNSPFEKIEKESFNDTQKVIFKLKFIPDIKSLATELNILKNNEFLLENSKKTQFIENSLIDDYSLDYLIYVKVINSFEILKNPKLSQEAKKALKERSFEDKYGNYFINGVLKGGEFIGLIKISTNSRYDYKNIKNNMETIGIKWERKDKILNFLKHLSNNHQIDIKNLIISNSEILPSDNLDDLFKNAEIFPSKIYNNSTDIELVLTPYKNLKNKIPENFKKIQSRYLNYQILKNDLFFILRNDSQFRFDLIKKQKNLIEYKKITDLCKNNSLKLKLNYKRFQKGEIEYKDILKDLESIKEYKNIKIPIRYKAAIYKNKIKIPFKKIFASIFIDSNKTFHPDTKAPWIDLKTDFQIAKNGKIIFLNSKIVAKNSKNGLIANENKEIVLDTYVDFPGLRFKNIEEKRGELFTKTITPKNNWQEFFGKGAIKSAYCGYDIEGKNQKENIGCVQIDFKKLNIEFMHEEDYNKEPPIYIKAKDRFSF